MINFSVRRSGKGFRINAEGHADTGISPDPLCAAVSAYAILLRELILSDGKPCDVQKFEAGELSLYISDAHSDVVFAISRAVGKLCEIYPNNIKLDCRF